MTTIRVNLNTKCLDYSTVLCQDRFEWHGLRWKVQPCLIEKSWKVLCRTSDPRSEGPVLPLKAE